MFTGIVAFAAAALTAADPAPPKPVAPSSREALQPFNPLVGSWKGTGRPETANDRRPEFWVETIAWQWKIKGEAASLVASFDKGKHFTAAVLEPLPDAPAGYKLTFTTVDKAEHVFTGTLKDRVLTADRTDAAAKEDQRVVLSLLHANRYLYRFETKPAGGARFEKKYLVGATKEGQAFAEVPQGPECVVTGGKASSKVTYMGVDYWVCCSGCREAFKENPEKYVKEAAAKAKK